MRATLLIHKISQIFSKTSLKQAYLFARLFNVRLFASTCLLASLGLAMSGLYFVAGNVGALL